LSCRSHTITLCKVCSSVLGKDSHFSTFLHDTGYEKEEQSFKLFTFSSLAGKCTVANKIIVFEKAMKLEVRSADPQFNQTLFIALQPGANVFLKKQLLTVGSVQLLDNTIFEDEITVVMSSPVCLRRTLQNRKTVYYSPFDAEFPELINNNFISKYHAWFNRFPAGDVKITPLVVENRDKYVTQYKQTMITAWRGTFLLQGKAEYLNFLYNTGIGEKNSQGFGMFKP